MFSKACTAIRKWNPFNKTWQKIKLIDAAEVPGLNRKSVRSCVPYPLKIQTLERTSTDIVIVSALIPCTKLKTWHSATTESGFASNHGSSTEISLWVVMFGF